MKILFLVELALLFIVFILLNKTEKKERLLKWISLSCILLICYNVFICFIFKLAGINCTFLNLSIINIILIILGIIKIIQEKKIQKYYIDLKDIIIPFLILLVTIGIAYKQFGIPIQANYLISDGIAHYRTAVDFYEQHQLLTESKMDGFNSLGLETLMPVSYVNIGILFISFSDFVDEIDFYKLFVLFDVYMLFLAGILMYVLISSKQKSKKAILLSLFVAIAYMIGYPLNSVQSGYSYLTIGLNEVLAILITIDMIKENDTKYIWNLLILGLLNFGLFFSYYFFVPVIYMAIVIWMLGNSKQKKEKILNEKNILYIVIALVIPSLYGIYYFILTSFIQNADIPFTKAGTDGDIYINYGTNFIILIPLLIIYCIKNIKKNDIYVLISIITIIFGVLMYILKINEIISEYYFMKVFYFAWIFAWIVNFKQIILFPIDIILKICIVFFVLAIPFNRAAMDIYFTNAINTTYITGITHDQKEIVKYYKQNLINEEENVEIYAYETSAGEATWMYSLLKNPYFMISLVLDFPAGDVWEWIENGQKEYCIVLNFEDKEELLENNKDKIKVLYENSTCIILQKVE